VMVLAAAWLHLQIVYGVLLTFVTAADAQTLRSHVGRVFLSGLLPLFASKNPREHDQLYAELTRDRRGSASDRRRHEEGARARPRPAPPSSTPLDWSGAASRRGAEWRRQGAGRSVVGGVISRLVGNGADGRNASGRFRYFFWSGVVANIRGIFPPRDGSARKPNSTKNQMAQLRSFLQPNQHLLG
jgi:hypothetical protein